MQQVFRKKCSVDKASAAYFIDAGTNAGVRSIPYLCLPTPGLLIVPNDARCFDRRGELSVLSLRGFHRPV